MCSPGVNTAVIVGHLLPSSRHNKKANNIHDELCISVPTHLNRWPALRYIATRAVRMPWYMGPLTHSRILRSVGNSEDRVLRYTVTPPKHEGEIS